MHFDLVDLRLFINVAETNSLTKGGERSHLSAPAASIRIKNIEQAVGTHLLERSSHGVTITQAGHSFLHHARMVISQYERLRADMHDYSRGRKGHVRVCANATASSEFLPNILRKYLAHSRDISVDLQERLSFDVVRSVLEGTSDIGVFSGAIPTDDLEVFPYRRDRIVVATSHQHPLARRTSVPINEVLQHDFVGLPNTNPMHTFLQRAGDISQIPVRLRIQVGTHEAQCRLIEANIGIGILPGSAAERYMRYMAIQIVPIEGDVAARDLKICTRSHALLSPIARELLHLLIEDQWASFSVS